MEGFVMALYNYTARKDTELSFRKGDVLVLLRPPDDSGWWYGRHAVKQQREAAAAGGAEEGLFPHNYVRRLELENYVARFAFKGKGDDEAYLPFGQGERLEVVLKDPNGWWIARKAGAHAVGLVPANYIVRPTNAGGTPTRAPQPGGRGDDDGQKQQAASSSSPSPSPLSSTAAAEQAVVQNQEEQTQTGGTSEQDGISTYGDGTASLSGQEAAKEPTRPSSSTDRNENEEGRAETSLSRSEGGSSGGEVSARLDEAIAQLRSLCARPGKERADGQRKRDSGQEGPAAGDSSDGVPLCLSDDHQAFVTFLRDQLQQREDLASRLSAMSAAMTMAKS